MIRPLGKLRQHYWLVMRMASRIGVDLVSARKRGNLSSHDWSDIVTACRGCEWAEKCDHWIDTHDLAPCAPATCVNRRKFDMIRKRQAG